MLLLRGGAFAAVLAENGSTDYSIVLAPDASPTDRFAAEELKTFLEQSTTARFPIANSPVAGKTIKNHPEYFSLSRSGVREPRQLCLSNPELRRTLTENFLAHAKKVGGRGFLDLSQEDAGGEMCMCADCRALARKYKSTGGPLFDYLVELAPKVTKKH